MVVLKKEILKEQSTILSITEVIKTTIMEMEF